MHLEEFNYTLDPELIAQQPSEKRDHSRMMVVDRKKEALEDSFFFRVRDFLKQGDIIVINDSRVIPARLFGKRATGGTMEVLLLSERDSASWEALLRPAKRARIGMKIFFAQGVNARIVDRINEKKWIIQFDMKTDIENFLQKCGRPPLPPYIKRAAEPGDVFHDLERYQTIYARHPGSIAAPTAGLHFSMQVMEQLQTAGIRCIPITLHVGYGTFLPIETEMIEDHRMEEEYFEISEEAAEAINGASRVIAVGTTSTRTLETATDDRGRIKSGSGFTSLFIYPGYRFRRIGGIITNFHLPKSSLLLLVSAFAGKVLIEKAYERAVAERYRFYSYGDCMLII